MSGHHPGKRAKIRIVIFALFTIAAVALFRFSPVRDFLTAEQISRILDSAGIFAALLLA